MGTAAFDCFEVAAVEVEEAADRGEQATNTVETAAHEVAAIEKAEAADRGEQLIKQ